MGDSEISPKLIGNQFKIDIISPEMDECCEKEASKKFARANKSECVTN